MRDENDGHSEPEERPKGKNLYLKHVGLLLPCNAIVYETDDHPGPYRIDDGESPFGRK